MLRIIAYKYPNNEIRIVQSQSKPLRRNFSNLVTGEIDPIDLSVEDYEDWINSTSLDEDDMNCELGPAHPVNLSSELVRPLSLGPNSKTFPKTAGYGSLTTRPSVFGLNAKRNLIRSGAALETEAIAEHCIFMTGTLPGSTEDAFRSIAEWSGYIVNGLKAWVSNYARQKLDFYCWEYQARGALHLHYCVYVPDNESRNAIVSGFKQWWIDCLSRVGEKSNCDLFRRDSAWTWLSDLTKVKAEAEICRKSPARYLAKYLSKSVAPRSGPSKFFTPSRWWGTSRPLKKLLNSLTEIVEIAEGSYHSICKKWESVKHIWSIVEGRLESYKHKFGMGQTLLAYPMNQSESNNLLQDIKSMSTLSIERLNKDNNKPSLALRILRDRMVIWCHEALPSLSNSFDGLIQSTIEFMDIFLYSFEA